MDDLWTALGLVAVIEGSLYTLFPEGMKRAMRQGMELPATVLRGGGLAAAALGVVVIWLVRS